MQRFAIYFTPAPESALAQAAAAWLGRDIYGNTLHALPAIPGITEERTQALLQAPRHYGFHATIKPPFRLKPGRTVEELQLGLEDFAARTSAFTLPPLHITMMGGFFCLRLQEPPALLALAAAVVRGFDDLREAPAAAELEKRRASGLSPNQEAMLLAWGYPYVLDEYRFHLTLTGPVHDLAEQKILARELESRFPSSLLDGLHCDALSLFGEEDAAPLRCLARYPLG